VNLDEDGQRRITWPSISFFARHDPNGEMDAILVLGPEPSYHWRAFSADIVDLARSHDARMVVTLGAFPAQMTHRDTVPMTGWAYPKDLQERLKSLDVATIAYEGPTNLVTAIGVALADARIPVAALWAGVPAFLGATANPKGALALVSSLDRALGLGLDLTKLREASDEFERTVNQAIRRVNASPELLTTPLLGEGKTPSAESANAEVTEDDGSELPSADEMIRGAEDFLRKNREF
jgi:proteasome assembly chaperone (PAC2) family protein